MVELRTKLQELSIEESLRKLSEEFPDKVVFSTSFGMEDQVITDFILSNHLNIKIFTLDTGRLFSETYSTWERTNERYKTKIRAFYPNAKDIETYVQENGPNAFYLSSDLRKECCYLRKVIPLKRALLDHKVWITGLRAKQSTSRSEMNPLEWDSVHKLYKFHPILDWETQQVKDYLKSNNVPYNPLHDKGFVSIGCAPCTRAVKDGEDFRAGRWWWEDQSKKECGLHLPQNLVK